MADDLYSGGGPLEGCGSLRVGCALLPKKVFRYLTPRMVQIASQNNIQLIQIDYTRPLLQQGPFHIIIHKLRPNPVWELYLQQYMEAHPQVVVIDRLDRIKALHNRATMLRPLQGDGITLQWSVDPMQPQHPEQQPQQPQQPQHEQVLVQAPLQVELPEGATEADAQAALAAAGLSPPLLCKPLWTDGREGSHGLAVLHDLESLGRLLRGAVSSEFKPPLVVQQFVEHGGVLFKVYVLGSQTVVTARPSLGETVLEADQGVQQLPRISCVSVFSKQLQQQQQQQQQSQQPGQQQQQQQEEEEEAKQQQTQPPDLAAVAAQWQPPSCISCPPDWVTSALAASLRQELGMQLFNFDLLIPEQQQQQQGCAAANAAASNSSGEACSTSSSSSNRGQAAAPRLCYVVDINYFPGVDKIPEFEERFVAFLKSAAQGSGHHSHHVPQLPAAAAAAPPPPPVAQPAAAAAAAAQAASPAAATAAAAEVPAPAAAAADVQVPASVTGTSSASTPTAAAAAGAAVAAKRLSISSSSSSNGTGGGGTQAALRRSSSSGSGSGAVAAAVRGISCSPLHQHSQHHHHSHHHGHHHRISSGGASSGASRGGLGDTAAAAAAAAVAAAAAAAGQWGESGVLGSSPPLQVAGCS